MNKLKINGKFYDVLDNGVITHPKHYVWHS